MKTSNNMAEKTITITEEEYKDLVRYKNIDKELLRDIAKGIKDILQGKVEEV